MFAIIAFGKFQSNKHFYALRLIVFAVNSMLFFCNQINHPPSFVSTRQI